MRHCKKTQLEQPDSGEVTFGTCKCLGSLHCPGGSFASAALRRPEKPREIIPIYTSPYLIKYWTPLFVIGSPAQFRNRFRSLSNVNRSGSQNASKNAAAAAEKTE